MINFERLKKKRPRYLDVEVPSWEEHVRLRRLSPRELLIVIEFAEQFPKKDNDEFVNQDDALAFGAELLARSITDEHGVRQFDHDEGRDFLRNDPVALGLLMPHAMQLHGLGKAEVEQQTALKKNSPDQPSV